MGEMINRVAKAVLAEYYAIATEAMAGGSVGISHTDITSRRIARAAIKAMSEPTEAMLKAAFVAMNETSSGAWKRMKSEGVTPRRLFDVKMAPRYRAMMAEALK